MYNSFEETWKYISNIKFTLESINRYFPDEDNSFVGYLNYVFKNCSATLNSGKNVLYRGRLYTEEDKLAKFNHPEKYMGMVYAGYDAKNSFVNLNTSWPAKGRMNPEGTFCLYTAKDPETCIYELCPGYDELISIAEIKLKEDLQIVDLSHSLAVGDSCEKFKIDLSVHIQELISQGGNSEKDYIFPQFIAECCKNFKYDGIAYRSKYFCRSSVSAGDGINVIIFNYEKCEPIGSKLYKVKNISIDSTKLT